MKIFSRILFILLLLSLCFGVSFRGLRVLAQAPHNITLTWTAPTSGGAPTSYQIFRGTTAGGESTTPLATVTAPTTTYQDSSGTGGTTYFYTVKAVNALGTSAASNEASATFFLQAPGAPGALAAVSN